MRSTGAMSTVDGACFEPSGVFMCIDVGVPSLQPARIKQGKNLMGVRDERHFN
jgi:hypothetical protein